MTALAKHVCVCMYVCMCVCVCAWVRECVCGSALIRVMCTHVFRDTSELTNISQSTVASSRHQHITRPCRQRKRFAKLFGDLRELDDEARCSLSEASLTVLVIEVPEGTGKGNGVAVLLQEPRGHLISAPQSADVCMRWQVAKATCQTP